MHCSPTTSTSTLSQTELLEQNMPAIVATEDGEHSKGIKRVEFLPAEYYTRFLSSLAKERKQSPSEFHPLISSFLTNPPTHSSVRSLIPLESRPGLISLRAGQPNASTFPITSLTFTANSPHDSSEQKTLTISPELLATGLQYGATAGLKGLCEWFEGLQEKAHGRSRGEGWRVSVGTGSQDVIYKVCIVTRISRGGMNFL
jgi:tryptophan aminotransferase